MTFRIGDEYVLTGVSSDPIRMRIVQFVSPQLHLYRIVSRNLFGSNFVQVTPPFMYFTCSGAWNGTMGQNDILGRWEQGDSIITRVFPTKDDCIRFCVYVGKLSNWALVPEEERGQQALEQSESDTPPNSPKSINDLRF